MDRACCMGRIPLMILMALAVPLTTSARADFWDDPVSGYFHVGSNWVDGTAPTAADTVEFGVNSTPYVVAWDDVTGDRTTRRVDVPKGDVTFRLYNSPSSPYTWTITDGGGADFYVSGATATLGEEFFSGQIVLDVDDRFSAQDGGTVNVTLGNEVQCDSAFAAYKDLGTLTIESGGLVSANTLAAVGYLPGSDGTLTVTGESSVLRGTSFFFAGGGFSDDGGDAAVSLSGGGRLYVGDVTPSSAVVFDSDSAVVVSDPSGFPLMKLRNGATLDSGNGWGILGYGSGETGDATVQGSGTAWTDIDDLVVGRDGTGTLGVSDSATVSVDGDARVARFVGSTGNVLVEDAGSRWRCRQDLFMGGTDTEDGGTASATVSGGGVLAVGDIDPATVLFTSTGGVVVSDAADPGGTLVVRNGATLANDGPAYLGYHDGDTAAVSVLGSGTSWTVDSTLAVGWDGAADLTVSDGALLTNQTGQIGLLADAIGTATVDGGAWECDFDLIVGNAGEGTLTVSGGGTVSNRIGFVAHEAGSIGTVDVTGNDSVWHSTTNLIVGGDVDEDGGVASVTADDGGRIYVGDFDPMTVTTGVTVAAIVVSNPNTFSGELTVRNGATLDSLGGYTFAGYNAGETGSVAVTGTGSTLTNTYWVVVGDEGDGTLTVTDGGTITGGQGFVANESGSTGTVTLDGGTWINNSELIVGGGIDNAGGTGTIDVLQGGRLAIGDTAYREGPLTLWPEGTLNVYGGTVEFTDVGAVDDQGGTLNFPAGTVVYQGDVTVLVAASSVTDFFGSPPVVQGGRHLDVRGETTLAQPLTLAGGTFSTFSIDGGHLLNLDTGTFNLAATNLTVGTGGPLGDTLEVGPGLTVDVALSTTVASSGLLRTWGGTFTSGGLLNQGRIVLDGGGSTVDAGAVTNEHSLTGHGTVSGPVTNASGGVIEALGSTLAFTGSVTNESGGLIAATAGNQVLLDGGLGANDGLLSLAGGIIEIGTGQTATSAGQIVGYGVLRTGDGLTNSGDVVLTGGTTTVNGPVTNAPAGEIEIAYQPAIFTGPVVNDGYVKVRDTTATFAAGFTNNGTYDTDPSLSRFTDVQVGPSGVFIATAGDRLVVEGNFLSASSASGEWSTAEADLHFRAGADDLHAMDVTGAAGGGWTDNFAWGGVTLEAAQTVTLADGNATPGASLYTSALTLEAGARLEGAAIGVVAEDIAATGGTSEIAADVLVETPLGIDVAAAAELALTGLLTATGAHTMTKTGDGLLVISGPQSHAAGTAFEVLAGTVEMHTDASGTGLIDDAHLSILVEDAELHFGADQHLDTLEIAGGGLVRFTGATVVVVKHLVLDGTDVGAATLTPEPATLALVTLGGAAFLLRRRKTVSPA